jgi:hypothetical protein
MNNDKAIYETRPIAETYIIGGAEIEVDYGRFFVSVKNDDVTVNCVNGELNKAIEQYDSILNGLYFAKSKLNERK